PTGGVWSGDSTDGTFDPAIGEGTYSITYTVDFGNDCIKEDTIELIISDTVDPCLGAEDVTIDPAGPFATDAGIQSLTALPIGGVWSGDTTNGDFDPSAGEGTYNVTYTVDFGNGCTKDETISIIVEAASTGGGTCTTTTNLALTGTASQSSTYGFGEASYAIDGNTNGTSPWSADLQHTVSGENESWWQVDLGEENVIEEIVIYNRTDKLQARLNNFYVLISENPFDENASLQNLLDDNAITNQFFAGNA
ncbi:discoidin domain-containing protein, partial [Croceitalea vernalis]